MILEHTNIECEQVNLTAANLLILNTQMSWIRQKDILEGRKPF